MSIKIKQLINSRDHDKLKALRKLIRSLRRNLIQDQSGNKLTTSDRALARLFQTTPYYIRKAMDEVTRRQSERARKKRLRRRLTARHIKFLTAGSTLRAWSPYSL